MKKNRQQKDAKDFNALSSYRGSNLKSKFRHRDRGNYSGRTRGK
jgi:hypothetical protein